MSSTEFRVLIFGQVKNEAKKEGYNSLPSSKPESILSISREVIKEPMFILLVACGSSYMLLGKFSEGLILLGFSIIILVIEFFRRKKKKLSMH